jgi:GNAT superfamily N-acetyltransferase
MNTLRYRFASAAEAPLLARLNAQLIATGADFGPAGLPQLERRMRAWLDSGEDHAVLFEDGRGRVLAYALYHEDAAEIYLRQFLVLDAARHGGVGRRAYALLRQRVWSRAKRLTLEVLCDNADGLRFWHEQGYRDCALTLEIPVPAAAPAPAARSPVFTRFLFSPDAAHLEFIRPRGA